MVIKISYDSERLRVFLRCEGRSKALLTCRNTADEILEHVKVIEETLGEETNELKKRAEKQEEDIEGEESD